MELGDTLTSQVAEISQSNDKLCVVNLTIPFSSSKLATIAKNSIDADQVPNPEIIKRIIDVNNNKVEVCIESCDLFKLRTSLNNFIEAILQVQKTIDRFRPDKEVN